ncbi:MAG TPA: response regulator transcription factor [Acidimicrobiales bacterium]|nr:response regulator transcription factor [Acidimicrobiales bacterium]
MLVVDDHVFYRQGIRTLLDETDDIKVVSEASSGDEALAQLSATSPDVVLLDVRMPGLDGIEVCRITRRNHPAVAIVIVTMFDDDDTVLEALRAGAHGYVLKDATLEELSRAIHAVHDGQAIFSPGISGKLVGLLDPGREQQRPANLTRREAQILELLAGGQTSDQIASRLGISTKTVRNALSVIYTKIGVLDRTQAAIWTREHLSR